MKDILETAIKAAKLAGNVIKMSRPAEINLKSTADYVTEIDLICQNIIIDNIENNFPDHEILAEENGGFFRKTNKLWIIDPLDGTTNFIRNLSHSGVSIAFYDEGDLQVGVVYDPYRDELFSAIKGEGAFLNDKPIKVSETIEFKNSLFATGFPFRHPDKVKIYKNVFEEVLINCSGIRRMGSAALDLCWTASGRYDGFFEGWLAPWDIAAGALILREAGGIISDFYGSKDYLSTGCVVCGNHYVFDRLFEIVSKQLKEL
ncbi:MAG: inositol monophosphatase [Candidatus Delongbacteria bacterium]|nr:inositol monophosphatase [Candidatus Delongbacteria bacterium]MBN2834818.1 inositol monophosphatase [Candidatus Delongbacteria bacterium]